MSTKSYHIPDGEPCTKCGKSPNKHRVEHKPSGDPCERCGLPTSKHRIRGYRKRKSDKERTKYIGIDGEGQGKKFHKYILLAASDEEGKNIWSVEHDNLSTVQCLDLILSLPSHRNRIFSFSFNYDLTKILTDVDDELLYLLFRPELRQRKGPDAAKGPAPIKWKDYVLNLQGTKFTVRKRHKKIIIWDLFKFFQAKFVNALKDWKVGNPELWERMSNMKDKRSEFDKETKDAVKAYCLEECMCIAQLARKLVESHESVGLKLKSFYGAGSSGAAMLGAMGIKEKIKPCPDEMKSAVAAAFAGGRFENSIIGQVDGDIYNNDISSAYPYHITFLPCLLHGTWTRTTERREIETSRAALVRYGLGKSKVKTWGPFPFRTKDGSISFPIESGGGWVWKDEYIAGEKIFPNVFFKEAWIYDCDCDCRPFEKVPEYYILRIKIGKEGPGIVIKLGLNSEYGKLAQSVGNAIFNSWIWAGMITSGCRAQVLDMLGLHKDWSNLLAVATDGIYTREKLITPIPRDTGTWEIETNEGLIKRVPLGGWETKKYDRGMFFARPGIYFPMNPTKEDIKDVRGRGVGKGVILENWQVIIDTWAKYGVDGSASVANVSRFCGAKTCISKSSKGYRRANHRDGIHPAYGQWIKRKVDMSFNPMPKRESMNADGLTLKLRRFPQTLESMPYDRAMLSEEAIEMKLAMEEMMEQPDGDFSDWEDEL
jgi:hypothetical protein